MKKVFFIALMLVTAVAGIHAQLLYKISGKDLKAPSYLVGTYHLAPVSFVDSIPGIREALTNTEQVCGELDMTDMMKPESMKKMADAMMMPDGKTLKGLLSADELVRFNKLLKNLMGADMSNPMVEAQLNKVSPQALNTQLSLLLYLKHSQGFDPTHLFDGYFQEFAKKNGEPIIGFETIDLQVNVLFKSMSLERQKQLLMCLVDNTDYYDMTSEQITKAFFAQDLKKMEEVLNMKRNDSCDETKEEHEILFDKRNADWITKMPAIMSAKPTFFAVGAGHLVGDKGLLHLLKEAGYQVDAVK